MVQNGDLTGGIIDGIVRTFAQQHASCRHTDGALRHVIGAQRDDVGRMAFELSCQTEAVLIGHLLGRRAGGIVQLLEDITCCYRIGYSPTGEEVAQRRTEGLCRGEEHTAIADRITLHKVEETIGTCLVIIVQTVTAQSSQQGNILGLGLRNIVDVSAGRVALVLDIQTELGTLDVRC